MSNGTPLTADLELWHATYEQAIYRGRDAVEAVADADAALSPKPPAAPPDWRNGYRIAIPRTPLVATSYGHLGPPTVMEYDEVFLSPQELQEIAVEKLNARKK